MDSPGHELYASMTSSNMGSHCDPTVLEPVDNDNTSDDMEHQANHVNLLKFNGNSPIHDEHNPQPVLLFEFDARTAEDGGQCCLSSIIMLIDGTMVVSDFNNYKLKRFAQDGFLVEEVVLSSGPWSMCMSSETEVAITLPWKWEIAIISTTAEKLTITDRIKTPQPYWAIAVVDENTYAVSSVWPKGSKSVDLISREGEVYNTFQFDEAGNPVFSWPDYLTVTSCGDIVVSDMNNGVVMSLGCQDGDLRFCHEPEGETAVKRPRGVCTDNDGHILFAEKCNHTVSMLTSEGEFIRHILGAKHAIRKPLAICVFLDDTDKAHIIVTMEIGEIKIFQY